MFARETGAYPSGVPHSALTDAYTYMKTLDKRAKLLRTNTPDI
jgi:hypothetical protein